MREKLVRWLMKKMAFTTKVELANDLLLDVLNSKGYSISNIYAQSIIETVIKSSGNKVTDFIIKDKG